MTPAMTLVLAYLTGDFLGHVWAQAIEALATRRKRRITPGHQQKGNP